MPALFGQSRAELAEIVAAYGEPAYRAAQIAQAIYRDRVASLAEITTLPASLREKLQDDGYEIGRPEIAQTFKSLDGTERYLVRLSDGETVETVWMPNGDGGESGDGSEAAAEEESAPGEAGNRRIASTLCISSQVGCAVNCQFCFTAKLGVKRNLTAGEIAGQVAAVLARHNVPLGSAAGDRDAARINIVFMGMGEPFLNYDNFMAGVQLLHGEMGIALSRMTVSTAGIVPAIQRFAQEPLRPKLAISLNSPNDALRETVMPINRKWNIASLMEAVAAIPLKAGERITFEYVLLGGVNDAPEHARELAKVLRRLNRPLKVNLIAWNGGPGIPYSTPPEIAVAAFRETLIGDGIPAFIRRPRGRDIYAACGQLKRTTELVPAAALT